MVLVRLMVVVLMLLLLLLLLLMVGSRVHAEPHCLPGLAREIVYFMHLQSRPLALLLPSLLNRPVPSSKGRE